MKVKLGDNLAEILAADLEIGEADDISFKAELIVRVKDGKAVADVETTDRARFPG